MTFMIREATTADYSAIAQVITAAQKGRTITAEELQASANKTRQHPKGLHLAQWVAETGKEMVGFAGVVQWVGSHHPDRYNTTLAVPPQHARQGIGTALADTVKAHLQQRGAREVLAGAKENEPHAVTFLERRGFTELEREFTNILKLQYKLPAPAPLPAGYRCISLADLMAEIGEQPALEAFRQCFNESRADEPRQIPARPYSSQDMQTYLQHPSYFPAGIQLAVTDHNEVAALTELWLDLADPHALGTGLTGTARAHRRKGLALALKIISLHIAQARGAQKIETHNASTNVPMLAINQKLGFRPEPAFIHMKWGEL